MRAEGRCSVSVAPVEDLQGSRPGTQLAFCHRDLAEMSGISRVQPVGGQGGRKRHW